MKNLILKRQLWVVMFMLLGCLSIHATDDDLITEQITVKLEKAGTLPNKISDIDKYKITNLKIIGDINGTDLRFIRDMAEANSEGNVVGKLSVLDLKEAKIVSGGDYYTKVLIKDDSYSYLYTKDNEIGDYAFCACYDLTSIVIPSSVTSIGNAAFWSCNSLTSVNIPSNVTSIGESAFSGCVSLININIPASVTKIGGGAFSSCRSLTSITIPLGITAILNETFNGCRNLTNITIPSTVTKIDNYAFNGCSSLKSISIPLTVKTISYYTFNGCSSLISINIPSSVTSIEESAFRGCSSLTSINIPSSVKEIGRYAFGNCNSLKNIYVNREKPIDIYSNVFNGIDLTSRTLYVPQGTLQDYKSAPVWSEFGNIVEYDATGIDNVSNIDDVKEVVRYNANGHRLDVPASGLNIVKYSDGRMKKVIVK